MIQDLIRKATPYIRKYSPVVLSCLASAGIIGTAVMAVKATPKAIALIHADSRVKHDGDPYAATPKEAIAAAWKCYIPAVIIGASTIGCVVGANVLNMSQQTALIGACTLVRNSYKQYQDKLKELYGEETHNNIVDSIVKEKCENVIVSSYTGWSKDTLSFEEGVEPEVVRTFYDSFSQRYFESTIERVIQAEYHLNRNFALGGAVMLNDFYNLLGLEEIDLGNFIGWSMSSEIYWIDFNHHVTVLDDGMEIYVIDMVFVPSSDYFDDI